MRLLVAALLAAPARAFVAPAARAPLAKLGHHAPPPLHASPVDLAQRAIICFIIDGLTRGPDADVHDPSVGSPKYPSRRVDVIYL